MILAAAIRHKGTIYTLPPPARHADIMAMEGSHSVNGIDRYVLALGEQGFLDDTLGFVDRRTSANIAKLNRQLTAPLIAPPNLCSDDLW